MKFCFFGHVHGNLKTLEDLFNLISKERLDYVVCMGDLLHNGTNYNEVRCLEFARELYKRDEAPYWVWLNGNHDKKILDNIKAEINIRIRKEFFGDENLLFMGSMPTLATFENDRILVSHANVNGTLEEPLARINAPEEAYPSLEFLSKKGFQYGFLSHDHRPSVFRYLQEKDKIEKKKITPNLILEKRGTYLINPGSINLPYKGFDRSFALFDSDASLLEIKTIS